MTRTYELGVAAHVSSMAQGVGVGLGSHREMTKPNTGGETQLDPHPLRKAPAQPTSVMHGYEFQLRRSEGFGHYCIKQNSEYQSGEMVWAQML